MVNLDNLSITLLEARQRRAPKAQKSKTAYQESVPEETQSSSVAEITLKIHSRLKHQPVTIRPSNTWEN